MSLDRQPAFSGRFASCEPARYLGRMEQEDVGVSEPVDLRPTDGVVWARPDHGPGVAGQMHHLHLGRTA